MLFKSLGCGLLKTQLFLSQNVSRSITFNFLKKGTNEKQIRSQGTEETSCSEPDFGAAFKPSEPIFVQRKLKFLNEFNPPRQAWVSNLDTIDENLQCIVDLHPQIFGAQPRLDLIKECVVWQKKYKKVEFRNAKVRHEIRRSNKKPWPQKKSGRARAGSRRSPLFLGGAKCHGPRDPTSHFYMMAHGARLLGLCATLTVKLAQDDLYIVRDLEIPTDDSQYMLDLVENRKWGPSVLFVDGSDIVPRNIAIATNQIHHFSIMPIYGLNVHSMLKHDTLVLSLSALDLLEERLLYQLHTPNSMNRKFRLSQV